MDGTLHTEDFKESDMNRNGKKVIISSSVAHKSCIDFENLEVAAKKVTLPYPF